MKRFSPKIYFVPFSFWDDKFSDAASIKYRAVWPSKFLKGSRVWEQGKDIRECFDYEVTIFQKVCLPKICDLAEKLKSKGKLVIFDTTDPIDQFNQNDFLRMCKIADLVITSNSRLEKHVRMVTHKKSIFTVEDGENLGDAKRYKHNYKLKTPRPIISWTGNAGTYPNLQYALDGMRVLEGEIDMRYLGEYPIDFSFKNLKFTRWSWVNTREIVNGSDISINPRDPSIKSNRLKSQNKTNLAWSMGVPVIDDWSNRSIAIEKIRKLLFSEKLRRSQGQAGKKSVERYYNTKRHAKELALLINWKLKNISFLKFWTNWFGFKLLKLKTDVLI